MTPDRFVEKWRASSLKERSAAQEHFIDLCALLDERTPAEADPDGSWYTFEKGASKTGGGDGYADVWRRDCFAWEYKGKHKDLHAAFAQLLGYRIALENPPLLIVSDMETIRLHTNFTYTVQQIHEFTLDDLLLQDKRRMLKRAFEDPESFKPGTTREQLTEDAARRFAGLAHSLRERGYDPRRVAHFVNKIVFCLFAEDIDILPTKIFTRMLENASRHPDKFRDLAGGLFAAMKDGGNFGIEVIDWFNGGLFDDDDVLPLFKPEIDELLKASKLDWSSIEPSIFGTLFERGLDPDKRSQLGAHYTDSKSILRIVGPVILDPLNTEWERAKVEVTALIAASKQEAQRSAATRLYNKARQQYVQFLERLRIVRVLDPACGSGNFLYLALRGLKDLEKHVVEDGSELGFHPSFPQIDPSAVFGIEVNAYAAELARVTIWIGQIQWMLRNNFNLSKNPILKKLDQIDCRDAVLTADGFEADWPNVDFIVGNPPFLGGQRMLAELGSDYMSHLRAMFEDRVPGGADLVTYWFEKARYQIDAGGAKRAGLVATNSIRGGSSRRVLDRIRQTCILFNAWSDEPWVLEGAAVRVSIVCFAVKGHAPELPVALNGKPVREIFSDLTGRTVGGNAVDLTRAKQLRENASVCFQGPVKVGAFDIPGD